MDKIAVLDFGCQYTHKIGEGVRKAGVFSEILPCSVPFEELRNYKGIILSGGPDSVYDKSSPGCAPEIFRSSIPVLGICYGMQLMAHELGGNVRGGCAGEYGRGRIALTESSALLRGLGEEETVWMSHGDSVVSLPDGFCVYARSDTGFTAVIGNEQRRLYGLQFHPEVAHTENGNRILRNFALDICGARPEWTPENCVESAITQIREKVGAGSAIVFASGGVDSSVAAVLAHRALGSRVRAVHIDNGFERKGEAEFVKKALGNAGIDVRIIDKSDYTIGRIGRTVDPEKKRRIVGDAFIEALYKEVPDFEGNGSMFLVQGTIYPDSVESGEGVGRKAALIKSHHNVASGMIHELKEKGRVVEPNILLYKSEVRNVARELGLPKEVSERHPFPGPGLAVRYVGAILPHDQNVVDSAGVIFDEDNMDGVVVPVGTVGVKGSHRDYGRLCLIYGEKGEYGEARRISNVFGSSVAGITRAALVLSGRRYSQDEWSSIRRMPITLGRLGVLREADHIAMSALERHGLYSAVSQMPVVLFPGPENPWVALRPVVTPDFMTLRPPDVPEEITWDYLDDVANVMIRCLDIDGIVLDTTDKPPATVEWE